MKNFLNLVGKTRRKIGKIFENKLLVKNHLGKQRRKTEIFY